MRKVLIAACVAVLAVVVLNIGTIDSALSHFSGTGVCPYCNQHDRVESMTLKTLVPVQQWFCSRCDSGWPK